MEIFCEVRGFRDIRGDVFGEMARHVRTVFVRWWKSPDGDRV